MPVAGKRPPSPLPGGEGEGEAQTSGLRSCTAGRSVLLHAARARRLFLFGFFLLLLSAGFAKPLVALVRLAASDSLFSHVPLIPFVCAYLIWLKRNELRTRAGTSATAGTAWLPPVGATVVGSAALLCGFLASADWKAEAANYTAVFISAYVWLVWALALACFGWQNIRTILFPTAFLVFMVPFPTAVTHAIEAFFQQTSAEAAALLFGFSQTPVLRDGLLFNLPGITLEVAQECSGIRSSLVLFITSLVAGYMFFEFKRYRTILALAVIPIGIIRNGFRILTIGLLCVHFGPEMIHSIIHRKGGPLFFALSLVPFAALLLFLYRRERRLRAHSQAAACLKTS